MNKPLRILHLEDQPDFSALVTALLEKERMGAEVMLVTDFASFQTALETGSFELIIADFMLPTCNGRQALEVARQKRPEIPFILLSGAIGEHAAVDILQSGATDYVLKNSLERLVPAIRRAIQQTQEPPRRAPAEPKPGPIDQHYRVIFDGSPVPMWVSDLKSGEVVEVNEAALRQYGYSRDEFLALTAKDICSPEETAKLSQYLADVAQKRAESGMGHAGLFRHRRKDGTPMDMDISWSILVISGHELLLTMAKDVTDLRRSAEALKKSQTRFTAAQRIARLGSWEMDVVDLENLDGNKMHWSEETCRIFGVQPGPAPSPSDFFFKSVHPEDLSRIKDAVMNAFRNRESYEIEHRILVPGGGERVVRGKAEFVVDEKGKPIHLRGIVMDITGQQSSAEPAGAAAKEDPSKARVAAPKAAKPLKTGKKVRTAGR